jgi:hypothetical protein
MLRSLCARSRLEQAFRSPEKRYSVYFILQLKEKNNRSGIEFGG